jgi:hypothetical protein
LLELTKTVHGFGPIVLLSTKVIAVEFHVADGQSAG